MPTVSAVQTNRIVYRPMRAEDSEAVEALYKQCFSVPWTLQGILEMFTVKGYHSIVACELSGDRESRIVGYVGMKFAFDEADITNVAVSPGMRRRGIAHELLRHLLEEAKKRGIRSIFLEVRASNTPAIHLYEHAAFVRCGSRKNYYTKPEEDALLMCWNVASSS